MPPLPAGFRAWALSRDETRPDPYGTERATLARLVAALEAEDRITPVALPRALYSQDQPRDPAGSATGGQWSAGAHAPIRPGDPEGGTAGFANGRSDDNNERLTKLLLHEAHSSDSYATGPVEAFNDANNHPHVGANAVALGTVLAERVGGAIWQPEVTGQSRVNTATMFARHVIDKWGDTSGDSDERAVAYQEAAREVYDLDPSTTAHMHTHRDSVTVQDRAYVKAEYDATQAWLKDRKITGSVTLYRGQRGNRTQLPDGDHAILMQPVSSWTLDPQIASASFARSGFGQSRPFVLTAQVPVSRIQSLPVTGRGVMSEGEVLVIGGPARVRVSRPDPLP